MKKPVTYRLDAELVERVKQAAGPRGATGFVERALEAALAGSTKPGVSVAPPPKAIKGTDPLADQPLLRDRLERFK